MSPEELRDYLHSHIPLSAAMGIEVEDVQPETVRLKAPLAPNINHRETVFGGSASAICILSAWSLLHLSLKRHGLESRVVIHRNTMDYTAPVTGEFSAYSFFEERAAWARFTAILKRRGMARISIGAVLEAGGVEAGRFQGEFVALRPA